MQKQTFIVALQASSVLTKGQKTWFEKHHHLLTKEEQERLYDALVAEKEKKEQILRSKTEKVALLNKEYEDIIHDVYERVIPSICHETEKNERKHALQEIEKSFDSVNESNSMEL